MSRLARFQLHGLDHQVKSFVDECNLVVQLCQFSVQGLLIASIKG